MNHNDVAPVVNVHSHAGHPYYQSQVTPEHSPSQHTHFSEAISQPVIPASVQSSDTQYSNREETQVPAPLPSAVTRRSAPEVLRPNEPMRHEPESLPTNSSSSSRGAAGQHRIDRHHPRSISRIPSQAPNSPNPSGTGWMGPPPGPPLLHPSRGGSMPLSPLPTRRQLEKKPPLACLFCRGRKIACGPPIPGSTDRTCK